MTRAELQDAIGKLETAIGTLKEPEKTIKTIELSTLKIKLEGMAMQDITDKLSTLSVNIADMRSKIAAANDANAAHAERVALINGIFDKLKGVVGMAVGL